MIYITCRVLEIIINIDILDYLLGFLCEWSERKKYEFCKLPVEVLWTPLLVNENNVYA